MTFNTEIFVTLRKRSARVASTRGLCRTPRRTFWCGTYPQGADQVHVFGAQQERWSATLLRLEAGRSGLLVRGGSCGFLVRNEKGRLDGRLKNPALTFTIVIALLGPISIRITDGRPLPSTNGVSPISVPCEAHHSLLDQTRFANSSHTSAWQCSLSLPLHQHNKSLPRSASTICRNSSSCISVSA